MRKLGISIKGAHADGMSAFLSLRSLTLFLSCLLMIRASAAEWSQFKPLPDAEGFASPFAGVSHGALIVAGGANIPKDKWADVFTKVWHDSIFVLEQPEGEWKSGFKLARPLGYGISVSADDGVLCFGGSDATRHYAEGFRLTWRNEQIHSTPLPSLPKPCANACGALVGRRIYIAGGIETPTSTTALHTFWSLDLDAAEPRWQELPAWPGPGRMLAVAGAMEDAFYLFSGVSLTAGSDGKAQRSYLRDAYRYNRERGWEKLADLPRATVAAPSPASSIQGKLHIFSGDDGANVTFTPVINHPGFPRDTLIYDPKRDVWSTQEGLPFSRATVPAMEWRSQVIIPNGEARPRLRTPEVWALPLPKD